MNAALFNPLNGFLMTPLTTDNPFISIHAINEFYLLEANTKFSLLIKLFLR